jgi:phosphoribosyl 1,2-cyclic phosphodiesterase
MRIRFWGVRGSIPTPQRDNIRYGGNTPCVEFRSDGGALIIVDCGTGLRVLGNALIKEFRERPIRAHILISHYHWDHIQGLPFFKPLYQKGNEIYFYALSAPFSSLQNALKGQMMNPYFPVEMTTMLSKWTFGEIRDSPFTIEDVSVQFQRINHPQGCLSFRIDNNGKSAVYATDNEPGDPESDRNLRHLARGADALIYDSQFSRKQLDKDKKGWGHSSWEEGADICKQAGVRKLFLFHFDPDSSDRDIDRIQARARKRFRNSQAAREGMEIRL